MIIMKSDATDAQVAAVVRDVEKYGLRADVSRGDFRTVIGLVGDERRGPWSYYHLERGRLDDLRTRIDVLLAGLGTPSRSGMP